MAALAVVETPSGKDAIAEGLLGLLKPAVQQLDLHVHSVRFVELVPACPVHVAGHRVIVVRSADIECCSTSSQNCTDISVHQGFLFGGKPGGTTRTHRQSSHRAVQDK
nr:uncharacterized protein LOC111956140 isoform X2 [Salvelinus alpinus]